AHRLYLHGRVVQLGVDAGAGRRGAFGDPGGPYRVEAGVVGGHVLEVDGHREDLRLVAAGLGQRTVDVGQGLAGLLADVTGIVVGQLARQVDGAVVDDDLAVALLNVQALDGHAWCSPWSCRNGKCPGLRR